MSSKLIPKRDCIAGKRNKAIRLETWNRLSGKVNSWENAATKGSASLLIRSAIEHGSGGTSSAISCQPRVNTALT